MRVHRLRRDRGGIYEEWLVFLENGSEAHVSRGVWASAKNPGTCRPGWFQGDSTIILGATARATPEETASAWTFRTNADVITRFLRGILVFACRRPFAGLHSQTYGACVEIFINGNPLETFGLEYEAEGHRDYFHRMRLLDIPDLIELRDCQTIYTWALRKDVLHPESQVVSVLLDQEVMWDIDYVGLLFQLEEKWSYDVALSYASEDARYISAVAQHLKDFGLTVYDYSHKTDSHLGDALRPHIHNIYGKASRFVVLFCSQYYEMKDLPVREKEIASSRVLAGEKGRVLPVRLDDSAIRGVISDLEWLDARGKDPAAIAERIYRHVIVEPTN